MSDYHLQIPDGEHAYISEELMNYILYELEGEVTVAGDLTFLPADEMPVEGRQGESE